MSYQLKAESDILSIIIEERKKLINEKGYTLGFNIPEKRKRKLHPFLFEKGAILEVKRASPSKGDIAPDLDSYKTSYAYCDSGAKGISCLTEQNFFKGTLEDLEKVCTAVDDWERNTGKTGPAVLRKDFLLTEEEVEVAYRTGADAVLLIARILSDQTITAMAKKCEELGLTALVEVRTDSDVEKLSKLLKEVNPKNIICGVNSRDLKDFSIDSLIPSKMMKKIKSLCNDIRIIYESGILSPSSAAAAGAMGFHGILLGEAAAKNPAKADEYTKAFVGQDLCKAGSFWNDYAEKVIAKKGKPVVKICGITNEEDALLCSSSGADYLGLVLWSKSKRCADKSFIKALKGKTSSSLIGVIADIDDEKTKEAFELLKEGYLDAIQYHNISCPDFLDRNYSDISRFSALNISDMKDIEALKEKLKNGSIRVLIDAGTKLVPGGTGNTINENLIRQASKVSKLWIAGGINCENVSSLVKDFEPELIDLSSSLESEPGIKDKNKVKAFFEILNTL